MKKVLVEIKPCKLKSRVDLVFDDGTCFNADRRTVEAVGVHTMDEIDLDGLDREIKAEEYKKGFDAALTYLEYRPRSEAELRQYLCGKQRLSEEPVRLLIGKLKEMQLVDDKAFAETWMRDRAAFRPKSRLMITRELLQKGVDYDTARQAVNEVDDEESAYKAGLKKARLMRNADQAEFSKRLTAYLARRGFGGDVTRATVAKLWLNVLDGG
jgi:regulatory protein